MFRQWANYKDPEAFTGVLYTYKQNTVMRRGQSGAILYTAPVCNGIAQGIQHFSLT